MNLYREEVKKEVKEGEKGKETEEVGTPLTRN